MSTTGSIPVESKSAKKRKAKAEAANGSAATTTADRPDAVTTDSNPTTNGHLDSHGESSFIKELTKNIRNVHKKLSASAKADSVIAENPNVALDDLVAQKKLNADQKAQILKKPGLQAQLAQLEEQLSSFRAFAKELEEKAEKEKSSLGEVHAKEIEKAKEEALQEAEGTKAKAVEDALRVVIQFLHTAASKRQSEEAESDEARAFEGALLLVYQGNETALSTLKNLIYGTEDKVLDTVGEELDFTFAQVKESSIQSAQELLQSNEPEEEDEVAVPEEPAENEVGTDNTIAHAGLTELDDTAAIQATAADSAELETNAAPEQTSTDEQAANATGESWDPQASMVTDTSAANEDWVQVPRDPAETDNGVAATPAAVQESTSWAEDTSAAAAAAPVGKSAANEHDGFEEVQARRERGGRGGGRGAGRGFVDRGGRGRGRGRGDGRGGGNRTNRDSQGGPRSGRGAGVGGPRGESKS